MHTLLKGLLISIGISLSVGVIFGQKNKIENYYYLEQEHPKREITKATYLSIYNYEPSEKKYITIERKFNTEQAFVYGILSFGACLIIVGFFFKSQRLK